VIRDDKWDSRYLELAKSVAEWSKDRTKVGAIVVSSHGQVLAQGYNGFPRGVADAPERLGDRETKLRYIVHAEMNCIYNACHSGVSLIGATLYVHGLPVCSECAKGVIQVGLKRVVAAYDRDRFERATHWVESGKLSKSMFSEAGVEWEEVAF